MMKISGIKLVFNCVAVLAVLFGTCSQSSAESVVVQGEFLYGPEISEKVACEAAEQRAKEDAVRRVYGEILSAEDQFSCRESNGKIDNRQCSFNRFAWTTIDGDIKAVKTIEPPTVTKQQGASKCQVTLEVNVLKPEQSSDPNFNFGVQLSASVLKVGDSIGFEIEPSSPLYMAVFGWTPSESGKGQVVKLFPNVYDNDPLVSSRFRLPSQKNSNQYSFSVTWVEGVKRDFLDEYLFFVSTKKPITWLSEYSFDGFKSQLREIPESQKRVHRKAYRVVNNIK